MIGWQINRGADKAADYVDAKQLRQQFYRPDIITATLRLGSAKQAIAQARNSRYSLANFLKKGKHQQGRLFIVAIGVSDYNDNDLDLNFVAKDATAFYNRLTQQAKKHHQSVKGLLVADGHQAPTAANITDALDFFENSNENDTVVLFLAGHGENKGMDYYFLAQNAEKKGNSWRSSTVVKWNNLLDNFSNSKG